LKRRVAIVNFRIEKGSSNSTGSGLVKSNTDASGITNIVKI